ncbi:hypothetical protein DLE01_21370 [Streptomyces sp. FT05W]|uniref:hypothetical protein n=1 Tax=[Kitasatospora] papulosa TaxID=1464011 RepID=UPI000D7013F3|nr:hypothetical protein [Streptomyces sp. FT05W]PWS49912.1 hypothetical protein DLE01_21370 [Streptomyces sp. FT05W]
MEFQEHVERITDEVVGGFPPGNGIYAVTFRIDSVDQDPRFPYVAVGYTTEAYAAEHAALASDSWEARWSYASFPATGLEGVREVGRDPAGAAAHRREAESRGFWYEDDDEPDGRDELLVEWFYEVCVGVARRLHGSGRIMEALGRPVPVILYDMFDPDAMFTLTSEANPAELVADFMSEAPR